MTTTLTSRASERFRGRAAMERLGSIGPEAGDAIVYLIGASFAWVVIGTSSEALYRQWGELAVGPFVFGALASGALALAVRRHHRKAGDARRGRRWAWAGRSVIAAAVFVGATAIPLGLEVLWRSHNDPGSHVQPEVVTIEKGGQNVAKGKNPYHEVTNPHGKVVYHVKGQPIYEGFLPYLPLMTVFGIPSDSKNNIVLTDARIFFSLVTLLVTAAALMLCPVSGRRKMRALQVLAILPTAALPLATGGDDMPVAALLLLGMVLAQRRQPFASGIVLGIVSAMKFTAWPLAALALFAARDKRGVRRPGLMFIGMLVVAGPVVVPFALRGPWAFFDNVILFPLGLSGVASPAASPLPGHLLVSAFPFLHRVLPVTVGILGGLVLAWRLYVRPPQNVTQVCMLGGVVMAVITLLAPATRIGYLLYPINFFVWAYLFKEIEREQAVEPAMAPGEPAHVALLA
ncbi:MAG TPA: glycosyltransferase 87 family protein [Acidimicrobiales bacterium]|nr:glycosyltransferase 87 family protein [Acidimicrobiales bacterium]